MKYLFQCCGLTKYTGPHNFVKHAKHKQNALLTEDLKKIINSPDMNAPPTKVFEWFFKANGATPRY